MDTLCVVCGEPWFSELTDMEPWERTLFKAGAGCPTCEGEPANGPGFPEDRLSSYDDGDLDPMTRINARETFVDGKAPAWVKPAPVTLWQCSGCDVTVTSFQGDLEYELPRGARGRNWYVSHQYDRYGNPEAKPAHSWPGVDLHACEFCLTHCNRCGVALHKTAEFGDTYDAGQPFTGESDHSSTPWYFCIDCATEVDPDEESEAWGSYGASDFRRTIVKAHALSTLASWLLDDVSDDALWTLYSDANGETEHFANEFTFRYPKITRDDLARLLRAQRKAA